MSYNDVNVRKMILYFKVDRNNKLWFLYGTQLRIRLAGVGESLSNFLDLPEEKDGH